MSTAAMNEKLKKPWFYVQMDAGHLCKPQATKRLISSTLPSNMHKVRENRDQNAAKRRQIAQNTNIFKSFRFNLSKENGVLSYLQQKVHT